MQFRLPGSNYGYIAVTKKAWASYVDILNSLWTQPPQEYLCDVEMFVLLLCPRLFPPMAWHDSLENHVQ